MSPIIYINRKKKLLSFIKLPPHQLQPFIERASIHEKVNPKNSRHYCCLNNKARHPYHILVVGTQECQHNIRNTVLFPSKDEWETRLKNYLDDEYVLIKTESMAALHLVVNKCNLNINKQYKHSLCLFYKYLFNLLCDVIIYIERICMEKMRKVGKRCLSFYYLS